MTGQLGLLSPTAIELHQGRWQDALAAVECDALIFDAPYGKRTHAGHSQVGRSDGGSLAEIGYDWLEPSDVAQFVEHWSPRTAGWICSLTDHSLAPHWEAAFRAAGRACFCPIPVIDRGSRVRLSGDGPSSWTVWMVVARPRTKAMAKWGTLAGLYERSPGDERSGRMGGKPLGVMRAIVRDYSRPGDLVCDPFAGRATTLLAAAIEGRRGVGSEVDPDEHALAMARIGCGYTPDMFSCGPAAPGWTP